MHHANRAAGFSLRGITVSIAGVEFQSTARARARGSGSCETGATRYAATMLTIGDYRIGSGAPTFVVAEAGVNHDGCRTRALQLVDAAAEAGADAVKFQMFSAADLVTASAPTAAYQRRGGSGPSQRAMLERLELSRDDFAAIKQRCDERSVTFLATPFGLREVGRLVELGVAAIKIASTDLTNGPLISAAASTGLPIILSTGASTEPEIVACLDRLQREGATDRLVVLCCVSRYPAPVEALNLRAIGAMQRRFNLPCGLSDHSTSVQVGGWAVAAGACVIEKHFTLDPSASGPDHAMSMAPDALTEYIAHIRAAHTAMGDGRLGMAHRESEVREVAGKSVVAAVDIPAGARLTADMLTLKRPGTGIPPSELDRLSGRLSAVSIPSDTILSWEMVR